MEDALEIAIRRITAEALEAVTPEEWAKVFASQGCITTHTDGDGVVMRYVEPWVSGEPHG